MSFDFFTLGGWHYWEDVFFYQKWRIQRHISSKEYRLLDPWDIRRHEGGFEDCRKAFVKFIDVYEIPRQKGHMIIMIPGLGDGKNIFKPMWRKAIAEGYLAAAVNYPSTGKDIFSNAKQIDFLINNLEDVNEISFVTKGIGGIILRKLLSFNSPWQDRLKINRIVQVSPPNAGSKILANLSRFFLFKWWLGPMLKEVTPNNIRAIPLFKKNLTFGVIYCEYPYYNMLRFLPYYFRKSFPSIKEVDLPGCKEKAQIKNLRNNPFKNPKVVNAVINFLKKGKFS